MLSWKSHRVYTRCSHVAPQPHFRGCSIDVTITYSNITLWRS
ncbi:hypothetical protein YTCETSXE_CDS0051 [Staphylococcus phage MVC_VPHSA2]|uniref:Uncharacterized protein n=1 Tax=Staphylococcus phage MVC_VPHSA1 TaxID=3088876 RepID=A0ABZ0QZ45_9CAUD|nr:hypothetical protein FBHYGVHD_CDS0084 [Staphylococcus phage MVC_VPHSA1]WPF65007.1 hypothetical protein YTCETSXE_CDS0051 [Staphylococcus phage MVC_VPHSA2]